MIMEFEKLESPIRFDDEQVHRSAMHSADVERVIDAVRQAPEHKGKSYNGYRMAIVTDGDGRRFYNITVFFRRQKVYENLNPYNLNGAEQAVFGQTLNSEDLARAGIGLKESRIR